MRAAPTPFSFPSARSLPFLPMAPQDTAVEQDDIVIQLLLSFFFF